MRHVFSGSKSLRGSGNNFDVHLKIEILCNLKMQPTIMKANVLNLILAHVRFMENTKKKLSQMYACLPGNTDMRITGSSFCHQMFLKLS